MELNDALRIPLAPSDVWDALQDLALLRASLDNCESFTRLSHGEYALAMTVPLGPLRARYEARAHVAGQDSGPADAERRTINFKARAEGIGSLRGQIEVRLRPEEGALGARERGTRIDYTIWRRRPGRSLNCPRVSSKTRFIISPTISSPNSARSCVRNMGRDRTARAVRRRVASMYFCGPSRSAASRDALVPNMATRSPGGRPACRMASLTPSRLRMPCRTGRGRR